MTSQNPSANTLGDAIRDRRNALGMTQEQLAKRAVVDVNTIQNLENGRTKLRRVTDATRRVERELQWGRGSLISVRDGGEPTKVVERPTTTDDLSARLPVSVTSELEHGEVIDYTFEETTVDGVRKVIMMIKEPDRPPLSREERDRLTKGDDTSV